MIVCVSPSSQHYDETHNTLKYANRAKNIKTKVSRNMINVNRHVSQYVKAIYELTQEVEELKKRLGDSTKEAMDKIKRQELQRDNQIKEGSKRLKIAYQNSEGIRQSQIQDFKNLQVIECRISLVTAWITAFDDVFSSEAPPKTLLTIRMEAETVLQELENSRLGLQHRLQGPTAIREVERALDATLRNLQGVEGVTDSDIASVNAEATLYKTMIERDLYQSLADAHTDSISVSVLSKAHFEIIASLNQLNLEDESAFDAVRKAFQELMTTCTNATSQIIRPNGELLSTQDNFIIPRLNSNTPRKKNVNGVMANLSSPLRGPFAQVDSGAAAPPLIRPSPRAFKVGTPKKAVSFPKKSPKKKRVRWQDETEAEKKLVLEENKRYGAEKLHQLSTTSTIGITTAVNTSLINTTSDFSVSSTYHHHPSTAIRYQAEPYQPQVKQQAYPMEQPPVRRNSKMAMGFLSRKQDTSPPPPTPQPLQPQPTSNNGMSNILGNSPLDPRNKRNNLLLSEADTSMLNNRPRPKMAFDASDATEDLSRPWKTAQAAAKDLAWSAARRRVSSGSLTKPVRTRRLRPHHSSPESNTSVTFRVGHARRMSMVPEKENIGGRGHVHGERHGHATVLSPKSRSSFKSSARRITISGRSDMAGSVGRIVPALDRAKIQGSAKPPRWK